MLLTATIILVLALLLYGFWDWIWHIAMFLALALLLYEAWPWLSQMQWDDSVMSWLQQIHLPQVSATNTPSGRQYVSPQRTRESRYYGESRYYFEALGQEECPRPHPRPILLDRRRGYDVFGWKGECWFLRHNEEPYRYLSVVRGRLQWCWPERPVASAVPCKSPDTGEYGWCWENEVSPDNDG